MMKDEEAKHEMRPLTLLFLKPYPSHKLQVQADHHSVTMIYTAKDQKSALALVSLKHNAVMEDVS